MTVNNTLENRLMEKLKQLTLGKKKQVEKFIDSLSYEEREGQLTHISTKLSESVFNKIWENPEDADYDYL